MLMKFGALGAAGFAALLSGAPAQAAVVLNGACVTDLTLAAGSTQVACIGRYDGNVLNNSNNATINSALTALGYTGAAVNFGAIPAGNILSGLNGNTNVDFAGLLNGTVFLGLHFGNGNGGPGNSTTFYRLNAANLDVITLNLRASSNAVILAVNAVPEPATWAMMLGGFGMLGAAMRRRRQTSVTFA